MKKIIALVTLILLYAFVLSCTSTMESINPNDTEESIDSDDKINVYGYVDHTSIKVSIIELIAVPEKYDGKMVRVIGVVQIEHEYNAIHLSTEDWKYMTNAIWIDPDYEKLEATEEDLAKLNGKMVLIEGIFKIYPVNQRTYTYAEISQVHRYQLWPAFTR